MFRTRYAFALITTTFLAACSDTTAPRIDAASQPSASREGEARRAPEIRREPEARQAPNASREAEARRELEARREPEARGGQVQLGDDRGKKGGLDDGPNHQ
jgi:hypothetical protein